VFSRRYGWHDGGQAYLSWNPAIVKCVRRRWHFKPHQAAWHPQFSEHRPEFELVVGPDGTYTWYSAERIQDMPAQLEQLAAEIRGAA